LPFCFNFDTQKKESENLNLRTKSTEIREKYVLFKTSGDRNALQGSKYVIAVIDWEQTQALSMKFTKKHNARAHVL
jgi:hypothetical protein